jgi:hypothetical protein
MKCTFLDRKTEAAQPDQHLEMPGFAFLQQFSDHLQWIVDLYSNHFLLFSLLFSLVSTGWWSWLAFERRVSLGFRVLSVG